MTEEDEWASFKEICRSQPSYVLNILDKNRAESGSQPDRPTHNPPCMYILQRDANGAGEAMMQQGSTKLPFQIASEFIPFRIRNTYIVHLSYVQTW